MSAERLLWILRLLHTWRSRRQLAAWLTCSTKEISRDLDELTRLGFALEYREGPHGRRAWRVTNARRTLLRLIAP